MTQRFEGKNLEEALDSAVGTLGVGRHQLTYHVLMEKRGFLGGVKQVVIEAEVNVEGSAPASVSTEPAREGSASGTGRTDRAPRSRGGRGGRGRGRGGEGRQGRAPRQSSADDFRTGDFEEFASEPPPQGEESAAALAARSWIESLIGHAGLKLTLRTEESEERVMVRLYGADTRLLIDRNGELLDAIQVLANKSLAGRSIEKDIELDSREFKEQRIGDLSKQAMELAEKVRRDGREQLLPAMSPIERRIVHLALQDDALVTTESRGEGFYKRVALIRRPDAPPTA